MSSRLFVPEQLLDKSWSIYLKMSGLSNVSIDGPLKVKYALSWLFPDLFNKRTMQVTCIIGGYVIEVSLGKIKEEIKIQNEILSEMFRPNDCRVNLLIELQKCKIVELSLAGADAFLTSPSSIEPSISSPIASKPRKKLDVKLSNSLGDFFRVIVEMSGPVGQTSQMYDAIYHLFSSRDAEPILRLAPIVSPLVNMVFGRDPFSTELERVSIFLATQVFLKSVARLLNLNEPPLILARSIAQEVRRAKITNSSQPKYVDVATTIAHSRADVFDALPTPTPVLPIPPSAAATTTHPAMRPTVAVFNVPHQTLAETWVCPVCERSRLDCGPVVRITAHHLWCQHCWRIVEEVMSRAGADDLAAKTRQQ
jgi:hypothetical protein